LANMGGLFEQGRARRFSRDRSSPSAFDCPAILRPGNLRRSSWKPSFFRRRYCRWRPILPVFSQLTGNQRHGRAPLSTKTGRRVTLAPMRNSLTPHVRFSRQPDPLFSPACYRPDKHLLCPCYAPVSRLLICSRCA